MPHVLSFGTYLKTSLPLACNHSRKDPRCLDTCSVYAIYALAEWKHILLYPASFTGGVCITNVLTSRLRANTRDCGINLYDCYNAMQQRPSWEADSRAASQGIICLLLSTKCHYHVKKRSPKDPTILNLVHVLTFRLHLPFDLSSVHTKVPQIIYIHRICQLNLCNAVSKSATRVTCHTHFILLHFITLICDEKHKLCSSPFVIYIYIYIYVCAELRSYLVGEAAGVQNDKKFHENFGLNK